jgi:hypothetical protein
MDRGNGLARRFGGISGLWRLILTEFAPLEADFARYYQLELAVLVFGPRVPLRRLNNLIHHLPDDSAFIRAVAPRLDKRPAPWTTGDYLAALIAELVDKTNRTLETVYAKKGAPAPKPLRIPRPGDEDRRRPVSMSSAEARAFFGSVPVYYTPDDETPPPAEPAA